MASRFKGTIEQLQETIAAAEVHGEWSEAAGKHRSRSQDGGILTSLTRQRMAIVVGVHREMPSDRQGVIHFGYNDHFREIIPKLCQRLKEVRFDLSAEQIANASQ